MHIDFIKFTETNQPKRNESKFILLIIAVIKMFSAYTSFEITKSKCNKGFYVDISQNK